MPAPVCLFAYNRPEHTKKALDALANNILAGQTDLFIFSDGPKNNATSGEIEKINSVRQVIRNEQRFKKTSISESGFNKGLSKSIITGITEVINRYGRVIVLEDDIVTDKCFLKFCNEALNKYEPEERVKAISGFLVPIRNESQDAFFSSWISCWGWATWKRSWNSLEKDSAKLLREIECKKKIKEFNFNDSYDSYGLLRAQYEGRVDSWAIRWHASVFLMHGLMLYPPSSLAMNIGMDGTGTHYSYGEKGDKINETRYLTTSKNNFDFSYNFPLTIEPNKKLEKKLQKYMRIESYRRPIDKVKRILIKILPGRIFNLLKYFSHQ